MTGLMNCPFGKYNLPVMILTVFLHSLMFKRVFNSKRKSQMC